MGYPVKTARAVAKATALFDIYTGHYPSLRCTLETAGIPPSAERVPQDARQARVHGKQLYNYHLTKCRVHYSTVTDLARFRGRSTSSPIDAAVQ